MILTANSARLRLPGGGQRVVKGWSKGGQRVVKGWSKGGQSMAKFLPMSPEFMTTAHALHHAGASSAIKMQQFL
jgi:hypothetical protein